MLKKTNKTNTAGILIAIKVFTRLIEIGVLVVVIAHSHYDPVLIEGRMIYCLPGNVSLGVQPGPV